MTCPSELRRPVLLLQISFSVNSVTIGRLVSLTFVVCRWEERAEHRLVGFFR